MKKVLLLITALILTLTILTSCSLLPNIPGIPNIPGFGGDGNNGEGDNGGDNGNNGENQQPGDDKPNDELPDNNDTPNEGEKPDDGGKDEVQYLYTNFTPSEKATITKVAGAVIPFVPNNEYYVEESYDEYYLMDCISFYTFGNTQSEFEAYLALFSDYKVVETFEDSYGDTWYCLEGANYVEMSYYYYEGDYVIDVYIYKNAPDLEGGEDNTPEIPDDGNDDSGENGGNEGYYTYTKFTDEEKALFIEIFGEVIPYAPNNEYYVEEYTYDWGDEYEDGLNFYTYGNTQADFNAYRTLFSSFTYDGTENDTYGDAWYYYTADKGYFIDMSYYLDGEEYIIDVYVYYLYEGQSGGGSDNGGSNDNGGNNGSDNTDSSNVITNAGAGLPEGSNGVYDVNFTDATKVKDVTDQGYYLDGCPTVGSPAILVIPVDFTDIGGASKGYSINNIVSAFNGGAGETDYYSVHDYYYVSSYGKLDMDITVVNEWFVPKYTSSYYKEATMDYYGDTVAIGDQLVMDEALAYLSGIMDLSKFDSDGNGIIDAVVLVTTLEIDDSSDFNWAYRYWNIYTNDEGYYYEYDGVSANDYLWASYSFMHESYDSEGYVDYTDTSVMNTYTYIHEMGHILGADDYYNTGGYGEHPMDGFDVMDGMTGDHNAFTKFNLGWLTSSRLVTTSGSVTLTLDAFAKAGDTIIIANNWNSELGAYQEYYIVVYYTSEGLNGDDAGYFTRDGIVVYHVNASLYSEEYDGEIYYDIYNNNTDPSDSYGTTDNLIEFVKSTEGNFTFAEGDTLPTVTDDQGNTLCYTFTVDSIENGQATITFTRK